MSALDEIDPRAVYPEDLHDNPDFTRIRAAISLAIAYRCGQVPDVHPRLHEAVNVAALELAKAERAAQADDHVEWHIEYADPGTSEWVRHARATGEEAARVAFNELRDADPAHQWRVVRIRVSETIEEW